jgi:hypothetical protein
VDWRRLRAEELPADLGTFKVASFAQSFHWMDRPLVAHRVRAMLEPDGAWIHIGATTHRGAPYAEPLPHPPPPWDAIADLVAAYLGPVRRAGQGLLVGGTPGGEDDIMREARYTELTRIQIDEGRVVNRGVDEIVASVFSMSYSAPHLFSDRLRDFESDLRALLNQAAPDGYFSERTEPIGVVIWRP